MNTSKQLATVVLDTEIRFVDKTDPSDPTRSEDFWTDTLKKSSENWNCTKGFLLIICTVMLQNCYEGKIVKLCVYSSLLYIKGYLLKGCIRRRQMPKRYAKYSLFLLSRDVKFHDCRARKTDFYVNVTMLIF